MEIRGRRQAFDALLRPFLRIPQVLIAAIGCAVLIWFGQWWWVPVPIVVAVGLYELFFWLRGDKEVTVRLGGGIEVVDPVRKQTFAVDPATIVAATALYRRDERDGWHGWLSLADREGVGFATKLYVPGAEWGPDDVDVDALGAILGGDAGTLYALATRDRLCRQPLDDKRGTLLAWARDRFEPALWRRTSVRLWQGEAPDLDLLGIHSTGHDAVLLLDGLDWTLTTLDGERTGTIDAVRGGRSEREVALLRFVGDGEPTRAHTLPLLVLDLAPDLTVAFPAPLAGRLGEERATDPSWRHTHLAEGAQLVWHLLRALPQEAWPDNLREAVLDARPALGGIPAAFGGDQGA